MTLHPADRLAFDKAMVTQPVWNRFNTACDAVNLDENILLHAGPAFSNPSKITLPILNSACVAAVFEGLAKNFDEAEAMILASEIILKPSQDHDVVTPLAAVVAPQCHFTRSMMHGVGNNGFMRQSTQGHGQRCDWDCGLRPFWNTSGGLTHGSWMCWRMV